MNTKTVDVFKAWLTLSEDEKRDFIKELLNYNNLSEKEKNEKIKSLDKK